MTAQTWDQARLELEARIMADDAFPELVRCYGGKPSGAVPSRRCSRLATQVCERLELDPSIYRGNVFGAAAHYIEEHSSL